MITYPKTFCNDFELAVWFVKLSNMYEFNVQKDSKRLSNCCSFDGVTDGTVWAVLEHMINQQTQ